LEQVSIGHWLRIKDSKVLKDGVPLSAVSSQPAELYEQMHFSYPKFFKMDTLSKWAWLGSELLLTSPGSTAYEGLDKNRIALVLATGHGCIDVDKKYNDTVSAIPSPALFVYTLPNIMLGEICIRHGFKGEQACMVQEAFDSSEIYFWVQGLFEKGDMDACLCGWADVANDSNDICLFWIERGNSGNSFSPETMQQVFNG